ncbi:MULTISPECIES: ABC transporter ATP-binding protein [Brevibacterium]|jgi:peptide/nickel transport system ATP-binding protein|uniref:ABC transporter ATP-binding protein n=1 Tax=Brevibacterium casei TaxID=33889 RepID=A0A7T3ZYK1_9MICO|nr:MULTISPECIES: ABC transporter ATP-binding protein [Brevibacterium]QQB14096.1 ABC transporter ATP-binding protein [Brevibacterium casei]
MSATTPALSYRDYSVSFGARTVTRDVSFDLVPGSILALVGESGSGKSVTALAPLGLVPGASQAGSVVLWDPAGPAGGGVGLTGAIELVGLDSAELRPIRGERVGVVFQEPMSAFNPMFRVGHQIAEAVRAHAGSDGAGGAGRGDIGQRVLAQLSAVGLPDPETVAEAYPHELSGGQLQRAMIALATINSPQVLIADEPTTALDVTVQTGILDLLVAQAQAGQAVLLITHDMGVVADIADRVAVMKDGRIVETGSVEDIFDRPASDYTKQLLAAVPRLSAVVDAQTPSAARPDDPEPAADAVPAGTVPAAELRDATVVHRSSGRQVTALDDVSLVIPAGQITGLVGESGSGKSTIANVLTGGQALTSGEAFVAGERVSTRPNRRQRRLRAEVGVVFQDPRGSLNPRRSVGSQIAEPLRVHTDLSGRDIDARVDALLADVQLPTDFAARFPHELSGGQRQRVAIARALALRPKLLIADEPTSALDVSVQRGVLALLGELHASLDFACLFISHDLAVVEQLASHVVVLKDGRIVEQGPSLQVLTDPGEAYTRRLIESAPVPDPRIQAARRAARLAA